MLFMALTGRSPSARFPSVQHASTSSMTADCSLCLSPQCVASYEGGEAHGTSLKFKPVTNAQLLAFVTVKGRKDLWNPWNPWDLEPAVPCMTKMLHQ